MKGAIIFLVIGVIAVIGLNWAFSKGMAEDSPPVVPFAISPAKGQNAEVHVAVGMIMTKVDPPRVHETGTVYWNEWVDDHFDLKDASGQKVALRRSNFSSEISSSQVGSPEFYVIGQVQAGQAYTLDYIPILANTVRYRHEFTVPTGGQEFGRIQMQPVD